MAGRIPQTKSRVQKIVDNWPRWMFLGVLHSALCILLVGSVSVADSTTSPGDNANSKQDKSKESEAPRFLPTYIPPAKDVPPARLPTGPVKAKDTAEPSSTSVLLPPIKSAVDHNSDAPPPRPNPVPASAPDGSSSTLLEPPPSVGSSAKTVTESTLEVVLGQPRLLTFPDVPHRVALAVNEKDPLASLQEVPHKPREWYLIGKKTGTTFLDVWLPDPNSATSHRVLHYKVQIVLERIVKEEKPVEKFHNEAIYETLECEINRTFPGSSVRLKRVGDSLVVSGTARNIFEASRILTIARENAPSARAEANRSGKQGDGSALLTSPSMQATLDNYAKAGGPHVINLLRIPGEQQIMLRVVVAEVNKTAARNLGLDFGLADKQATVLPNRPAASDGSSTVSGNGWVGQILRTLQEHNLAQPLAEPTLTTINGQTARFQAGGEFPIPVVSPSPAGAVQGVAFRSYGVQLSVQPVIADADRIRLTVEAEVSGTDPQATAQVGGTSVPGLKVRNFQSTVELREGETLAVAGLIRGPTANALPQGVYPAQTDNSNNAANQELVVLISPLLLHTAASARTGGNPLSAQNIELYLRSRNTSVPRGDSMFLIGPQGYAGSNH